MVVDGRTVLAICFSLPFISVAFFFFDFFAFKRLFLTLFAGTNDLGIFRRECGDDAEALLVLRFIPPRPSSPLFTVASS